jgi:hypothetical protein
VAPRTTSSLSSSSTPPPPADALAELAIDRPVTAAIVEGGTAAAAGALTGFWLLINTMLNWLSSVALPGMLQARLLSKVLSLWNGASPVGLQVLLEKLQLIGSGLHVAPPQMVQFRDLVKGLSWVTMRWTRERLGWLLLPASAVPRLARSDAAAGRINSHRLPDPRPLPQATW